MQKLFADAEAHGVGKKQRSIATERNGGLEARCEEITQNASQRNREKYERTVTVHDRQPSHLYF